MEDKFDRLRDIKIENYIWIIYIVIIILSYYSNYKEKMYILYQDNKDKEEYRRILIFIFSILVIVYYYFTKESYSDYKEMENSSDERKKMLTFISFLGSLLVLISGILFLSIAILDENIDVEIAFS